jgi:cell division protease FtsH
VSAEGGQVSDRTRQLRDEEQQHLADEAMRGASRLLAEHRDKLDQLAAELLRNEVLEREDIDRIMSSGNAPSASVERLKADLSKAQIAAAERLGH